MAYVSGILRSGQKTGIGAAAVVLAAATDAVAKNCREVLVQSDPANTTNMKVGSSTDQFVVLTPGQSITIPIFSPTLIFVKMASGTGTANWLSRD